MATKQIKSLVQFSRGTSVVLANLATPIPDGVVVFSIDDGAFKIGDGITMYTALPILFTYSDLVSAQGGISNLFQEPVVNDNGKIAVIKFDQMTNKVYYGVSDVTLASLLASVSQLESENTAQDTAIASLMNYALSIDAGINTAPDNNIVTINNRRYSNSGMSIDGMRTQIENLSAFTPGSHLLEPVFYADVNKTNEVDKENLLDNNTYYIDIKGFNNAATSVTYSLTAANSNVVITQIEGSLFSFQLNNLTGMTKDNVPFALIIGINNQNGSSPMKKAIGCKAYYRRIITGIYGGVSNERFESIASDNSGNIICVGFTVSEGQGGAPYGDALIVKFDSELNIVARKVYGGTLSDGFKDVATDSSGNIYAVGWEYSEGSTSQDCLVVKFDSNLNILITKRYYGASGEFFFNLCISGTNLYIVGTSHSEGLASPTYSNALIVKFDTSLNILARKRYGGASGSSVFTSVDTDTSGNVYAVGYTLSEGSGGSNYGDALIVKFDSDLNILARKIYGGAGDDYFEAVVIDRSDNVYCSGSTYSEGIGSPTYSNALIIKFDNSLNIIGRKIIGSTSYDTFRELSVDSLGNVYAVGTITLNTYGLGCIIKFDSGLNVLSSKVFGGVLDDSIYDVCIYNDHIYVSGNTLNTLFGGTTYGDSLIVRMSSEFPVGTFIGTTTDVISFYDFDVESYMSNSNLTLVTSALTLANSTLTLTNITTLTLAASNISYTREVLN